MKNLMELLIDHLKKEEKYVDADGNILKSNVKNDAFQMNDKFLKLIFDDQTLRQYFFNYIDGFYVFDKVKFSWVVDNKQFLPDSYTMFKNKIGFTDNNNAFLINNDEIILSWPYKDCYLEGGQSREEEKKEEVFYNETLSPEEIDSMLSPKIFKDATKYTAENSFRISEYSGENLLIKGNNLIALSSIADKFKSKIDLIYIDPPFNTENDSFNYNDKFTRSTWLTFMKNRLEIAKRLLKSTGNIFIHIDDNNAHYLKVLCDEIFGEDNFVEEIIWSYGSPSGGRATTPKPVSVHNYLLHYSVNYKDRKQRRVYTPYSDKYIKDWFKYKDEDGRKYQKRFRESNTTGKNETFKQFLDESKGMPLSTVWSDIKQVYADPRAYKESQAKHSEIVKEFNGGQKPERLIKRIIQMATDENDLVLDFHLGTGTTVAAAHKLNRRYIGIEQMDYIKTFTVDRMKRILSGESTGISKDNDVNWLGGGSFVYCELEDLNSVYMSEIINITNEKELLKYYDILLEDKFIHYKIAKELMKKHKVKFEELTFNDKKQFLLEILDKNLLYVNLSDIDNQVFEVSDSDKKFNNSFYFDRW